MQNINTKGRTQQLRGHKDYHFYDTGDDNNRCLITNQYNCRDFETFQPCTGFSDRISFVDC